MDALVAAVRHWSTRRLDADAIHAVLTALAEHDAGGTPPQVVTRNAPPQVVTAEGARHFAERAWTVWRAVVWGADGTDPDRHRAHWEVSRDTYSAMRAMGSAVLGSNVYEYPAGELGVLRDKITLFGCEVRPSAARGRFELVLVIEA